MNTEFTIEELLTKIQTEAKLTESQQSDHEKDIYFIPDISCETFNIDELLIPFKTRYCFNELLQYDDGAFITTIYRALLKRNPDPAGYADFLHRLHNGALKGELLLQIADSPEAAQHETEISGISLFVKIYRSSILGFFPKIQKQLLSIIEQRIQRIPSSQLMTELHRSHYELQLKIKQVNTRVDSYTSLHNQLLSKYFKPNSELYILKATVSDLALEVKHAHAKATPSSTLACDQITDDFYLAFENACRGTTANIHDQQSIYLSYLPHPNNVKKIVDFGCGRGEWLELLKDKGYKHLLGIDINQSMVETCKHKGINVEQVDVLNWLQNQESCSLTVFTGFHVIEHIPFDLLLKIMNELHRVLDTNGVVIFETPNPENVLVGSHTFYHDPTHKNPLTPTLLEFLASYCGFEHTELLRLHPYPETAQVPGNDPLTQRFNGHFCGPQDIAIIARKTTYPDNVGTA